MQTFSVPHLILPKVLLKCGNCGDVDWRVCVSPKGSEGEFASIVEVKCTNPSCGKVLKVEQNHIKKIGV